MEIPSVYGISRRGLVAMWLGIGVVITVLYTYLLVGST